VGFISSQNCQLNIPTELNEVDGQYSMVMDKIFNIKDFSHLKKKKESTIEIYNILESTKGNFSQPMLNLFL